MKPTILKISQETMQSATGKIEPYIRIDFKVGEHGPFSEHFIRATYSPEAAMQVLNTFAQMIERTKP